MFDHHKSLAAAHVFYDDYLSEDSGGHFDNCSEIEWRKELLKSPNGHLLTKNAFFDSMNDNVIWLAHVTSSLDKIQESGSLHPSGGCLVGSIYSVPAYHQENDQFKMHNLGEWIYLKEAPIAIGESDLANLDVLLFKIDRTNSQSARPIGIDYTRLGQFHFENYMELKYLLTRKERHELEDIIEQRIKHSAGFLSEANRLLRQSELDLDESVDFIDKYCRYVKELPILGYFYFEVLVDYIMYYQDDDISKGFTDKGEFYNYYYKLVAQDINKTLYKQFKLSSFAASSEKIINILRNYTNKGLIFKSFDEEHFIKFVARRLLFMIHSRLTAGHEIKNSASGVWGFHDMSEDYAPLVGHLIHRELRSFNRFPDFYYYFDQMKALRVWNYWNNHGIVIPFNGILPKGEVGINPTYIEETKYSIYRAKPIDNEGTLIIDQELDIKVASKLIDLKHTLMRNR